MSYKIAIIEDDLTYQKMLENLIESDERLNLVFIKGDSVSAAMEMRKQKPDILLLDIKIQGLNGLEVLSLFEEIPETIILTSHNHFRKKSYESGASGFISKPLRNKSLMLRNIDQCIENIEAKRVLASA